MKKAPTNFTFLDLIEGDSKGKREQDDALDELLQVSAKIAE
jgi:hypothetical protein